MLLLCYFKEKFRQLVEINEMVGGALDDTNPNRELIKEGKVTKISARDGAHLERYLFLVLCLFFIYCINLFADVFSHVVNTLYLRRKVPPLNCL